ncbi:MAG: CotH kinase family protein [Bacteroidetes bacterium]|nr:CotH kinase family protein [Bacteroidota bacterium]
MRYPVLYSLFILSTWLFVLIPLSAVQAQTPDPPVFSHESGLYRETIQLRISHPDPNIRIYVSFGPEIPQISPEYLFTDPIQISDRSDEPNYWSNIPTNTPDASFFRFEPPRTTIPKATVVRAIAVNAAGQLSEVVTKTYWVHPDKSFRFHTPVISVVATYDDFFSHERGIYVPGVHAEPGNIQRGNFEMRGVEWERPGVFTMIDSSGAHMHTQQVGYRIHGGWSRHFPSKSLRIYARNAYEDRIMPVELFPGEGVQPYRRFLLRAFGNDQGRGLLRDPLAQHLVAHLSFDTQGYHAAVVYINGEYWGMKNIRDRYTRHFLERVHGVNPDHVSILEIDAEVKDGTNEHYLEMRDYAVTMDLSVDEHFEWMASRMDMQNFIEYVASQIVLANNDWPHNNIDFWRYDGETADGVRDGRWRWLMFDIDRSFGLGSSVNTNMLNWLMAERNHNGDAWPNLLFRNLIENEGFRNDLINTVMDLLNTTFQPEYVISKLDSLAAIIEPEVPRHIQRWQRPTSTVSWYNTLFAMRNYAEQRPSRVTGHLSGRFDTGDTAVLNLYADASYGGYILLNYMPVYDGRPGISASNGWWSGQYFEQIPVRLQAQPMPGYRFEHWVISDSTSNNTTVRIEPELQFEVRSGTKVQAVFAESDDVPTESLPVILAEEPYVMNYWPEQVDSLDADEALFFVYMNQTDPLITAEISGITSGDFNLDSRTRVVSLGEDGFAFINTSNLEGNPGYPGTRLGGAILPVDTRGKNSVAIDWIAGTVYSNSRIYNLRLQYRIGTDSVFQDVLDDQGNPVEYERNDQDGHREVMPTAYLPQEALNQPYVELFWRYYHTGERISEESGQRSKLAIHAMQIHSGTTSVPNEELPSSISLQAFPNPFNSQTTIEIISEHAQDIHLQVFDLMGRRVNTLFNGSMQPGMRSFTWDASSAASGMYVIVAESSEEIVQTRVTLIK